ncbi:MAG: SGNH/GDSL hydrolase family protein [Candidatus Eisenbacteria bacterium]
MTAGTLRSNLFLSLVSVIVTLVLVELGLSLFHPIRFRRPLNPTPERWTRRVIDKRSLMYRRSSIPGLCYELIPDKETRFLGEMIVTNSYGMRDSEPLPPSDTTACNVLVLGDSFTFGYAVPGEAAYPSVLEELLAGQVGDKPVQVLNLGVGGYATREEAIVLRHVVSDWRPSLIIVGYVLNDPEIDPVQPLHGYFSEPQWWQHLNILRLAASTKLEWDIKRFGEGDYYRYLHAKNQRKWRSVVDAFDEMKDLAQAHNAPVVLVVFPVTKPQSWSDYPYLDLHEQVLDAGSESGFHVIDMYDVYSQYPPEDISVTSRDFHPSVFAHELAAKVIYEFVENNSLLTCR